ncbi:ABC transporter ATP-binding protein [Mesorhizobium yinganensis]|uniref:ABC transporter ATP-binding protein n=1 Tax=Mesorhizobium yinganensis TaxID=3157707 RepID=UPI0032B771EB
MTEPLLFVECLQKSFGGLSATDGVSLQVSHDSIHAIIGPNGAGKTTLLSQLFGQLRPDAGRIVFNGTDVTHASTSARVRLGMARSFQITSLCLNLSVLENVLLASQLRRGGWTGFWRRATASRDAVEHSETVLAQIGLLERRRDVVEQLSHGEQRQLEVAVALALDPLLLLLDEPLAGLGPDEATKMIALLKNLKGSVSMLLIEHDIEAVFSLADRITVLDFGRVIASGPADEIRGHPDVRKAYLGHEEEEHA